MSDHDDEKKTDQASPVDALIASAAETVSKMVSQMIADGSADASRFATSLANAVVVAAATGKPQIVAEVANQGRVLFEIHRIRVARELREQVLSLAKAAAEMALSSVLLAGKGGAP